MKLRTALAVLLLAQLGVSAFSPEEVAKIDALPVGGGFVLSRPSGDGCNSCDIYYRKTGERTVKQTGWGPCTLLACTTTFPEERYK